jgi:Flp pilus assembly pilin Flp
MKTGQCRNQLKNESAVANMIEYLMISGVIMVLLIVMLLLVNTNIMENPANRLIYVSFTDIGNGISTRMVDVYAIAPNEGMVYTKFDIPDEIVGRSYFVELGPDSSSANQDVRVFRGGLESFTALAGIATTKGASGQTTGAGINTICYNWTGDSPEGKC